MHDPLTIGTSETMGGQENVGTVTTFSSTISPTNRKVIQDTSGLDTMIKSVVEFCKRNSGGGSTNM